LHPSFENAKREVTQPPFEVTETGWGEFEIVLSLFFVDEAEKVVELYHPLKLFPPYGQQQRKSKPVISEQYETIVFTNPSEYLHNILLEHPQSTAKPIIQAYETQNDSQQQEEQKNIIEAQKKVRSAIQKLKNLYKKASAEGKSLQREIQKLEAEENKPKSIN